MGLAFSGGRWEVNLYFAAIFVLLLSGPLAVILGFVLCCLGLSGYFEFTANLHGLSFAMAGATPGLFFAACGPFMVWLILRSEAVKVVMADASKQSSEATRRGSTPAGTN